MTSPSVGRIVHYLSRGSADGALPPACRAAIITEVCEIDVPVNLPREQLENIPVEPVSLAVLNPAGLFFDEFIEHDADATRPGTWHWPERVQ